METSELKNMLRYFSDADILHAVQEGHPAIASLLKSAGVQNPQQSDIDEVISLAGIWKTRADEAAEEERAKQEAELNKSKARQEYSDAVRKVMSLDPRTKAVYAVGAAASEGAHGLAKGKRAEGNHMAQAILESARSRSPRQEELYGPGMRAQGAALAAHDTAAKGEKAGAILDAFGNALGTVLGIQRQEGAALRQLEMTPYNAELGLPGDYWQALSQREKRAQKSLGV